MQIRVFSLRSSRMTTTSICG